MDYGVCSSDRLTYAEIKIFHSVATWKFYLHSLSDRIGTLSTNCLFVIDNNSPLNLAFEVLLAPSSGVVATKSNALDFQGLVAEAYNLNSEVVIIDDAVAMTRDGLPVDMFVSNPELKVIVVLKDGNCVHVFRKAEILLHSASEFLEIIRTK